MLKPDEVDRLILLCEIKKPGDFPGGKYPEAYLFAEEDQTPASEKNLACDDKVAQVAYNFANVPFEMSEEDYYR